MNEMKKIDRQAFVSEIVKQDYRTAGVFRRHGIAFCCGSHIPLELACQLNEQNVDEVLTELVDAVRTIQISGTLRFNQWDPVFLCDYIIHVHHDYLRITLPSTLELLKDFAEGHLKKYPWLTELVDILSEMNIEMLNHIRYEEEVIFVYIRQIWQAYTGGEVYARLLVRTLSKPVEAVMKQEHQFTMKNLERVRELTQDYTVPPGACTSHKVSFLSLNELDENLIQHLHLENNILFPKAIRMEKELLLKN
jgi:regulator of cell morphogenesis and NO signaling